jgi:steroid 5-alpha reductase family enzyme
VSLAQLAVLSLAVAAGLAAVMAMAWRVQQVTGHSGWIDASWTFGVGGTATLAALAPLGWDPWPTWRQILVAALVAAWSLRLGSHIAVRNRFVGDDPRYHQLTAEWGTEAPRRMFWFLQKQAWVGAILAVCVALAARNPNPAFRIQDVAGMLLLATALIGEAIADAQLRTFKAGNPARNAVCDAGLWRWSRHPNYFFEWLAWLAYPAIAIDTSMHNPWGWLALVAPVIMYWALVHVSGIPPLEEHMLRTRDEAYRDYQRRTRPFLPLPLIGPARRR